jgi:multisubunit Na+/H+ antiporter MnhB subunit
MSEFGYYFGNLELNLVLLFMIVAAIIAVRMKEILSSIIALGAVGLGVSIAFLILKAPDLAITQLVVEILILIILIRATIKRDLHFLNSGSSFLSAVSVLGFIAVFLYLGYLALRELPTFGNPIMKVAKFYIEEGFQKTGAANQVGSVILDFRAYDTLGEATVLFTAVVGALAVLRKIGRKREGVDESEGE